MDGSGTGTAVGQVSIPLQEIQQFLLSATPVAAVAHSHHVDALSNPTLRADPTFQQFSLAELNELHHQVAALGSLLRLQMGDAGAARSLGYNLAGFLQNRQIGLQLGQRLSPTARNNPSVQALMQLTQVSNQQIAANQNVLNRTLAATGAAAPGPLLVRDPS